MNLTAKQFAEIVEALHANPTDVPVSGHDKRRATRVTVQNRATIIPYADGVAGQGVGVEVRDFSARGIRFLHSSCLPRGEQFVLKMPQQTGDPLCILCTVMHCRATAEGPFSTGAEFTCVLHPEKASRLTGGEHQSECDRIRDSILD
jgi:hypothetical protein